MSKFSEIRMLVGVEMTLTDTEKDWFGSQMAERASELFAVIEEARKNKKEVDWTKVEPLGEA